MKIATMKDFRRLESVLTEVQIFCQQHGARAWEVAAEMSALEDANGQIDVETATRGQQEYVALYMELIRCRAKVEAAVIALLGEKMAPQESIFEFMLRITMELQDAPTMLAMQRRNGIEFKPDE